jgi:hypothetical protein
LDLEGHWSSIFDLNIEESHAFSSLLGVNHYVQFNVMFYHTIYNASFSQLKAFTLSLDVDVKAVFVLTLKSKGVFD